MAWTLHFADIGEPTVRRFSLTISDVSLGLLDDVGRHYEVTRDDVRLWKMVEETHALFMTNYASIDWSIGVQDGDLLLVDKRGRDNDFAKCVLQRTVLKYDVNKCIGQVYWCRDLIDFRAKNCDNSDPHIFWFAVKNNKLEIVEWLLKCGANVNMINDNICSAICYAAIFDNLAMVKLLLAYGASLTMLAPDVTIMSLVSVACENVEIIRTLYLAGASIRGFKSNGKLANVVYINERLKVGAMVRTMMTDRSTYFGWLPREIGHYYIDAYLHGSFGDG